MLNYATVGSNKLPEALAFYDALLGDHGWVKMSDHKSGGRFYRHPSGSMFAVLGPVDGQPATTGNGAMLGFWLDSPEGVTSFYEKAIALGGTDEGAAGNRGTEQMPFYFGYFRDLDGNKLCAYHVPPRPAAAKA